MLRRSNSVHEVVMFSLIALYFDYRTMRAQRAAGPVQPVAPRAAVANDTVPNRAVATAA